MSIEMTPEKQVARSFLHGLVIGSVIGSLVCIVLLHFTMVKKVDSAFELGQLDVALDAFLDKEKDRSRAYLLELMAKRGHAAATMVVIGNSADEELKSLRATGPKLPAIFAKTVIFSKSDEILLNSMETMTDVDLHWLLEMKRKMFDEAWQEKLKTEVEGQTVETITRLQFLSGSNLSKTDRTRLATCLERLEADWPGFKEMFNTRARGLCASKPVVPAPASLL